MSMEKSDRTVSDIIAACVSGAAPLLVTEIQLDKKIATLPAEEQSEMWQNAHRCVLSYFNPSPDPLAIDKGNAQGLLTYCVGKTRSLQQVLEADAENMRAVFGRHIMTSQVEGGRGRS